MSAMDNKTVKRDNKTSEMDNKTAEIDRKTVEISRPKDTLFQDTLGTLFNTNHMTIMVGSVVSLILISLLLVFA